MITADALLSAKLFLRLSLPPGADPITSSICPFHPVPFSSLPPSALSTWRQSHHFPADTRVIQSLLAYFPMDNFIMELFSVLIGSLSQPQPPCTFCY